jgi:DUF4097 and DUF4098 domain-containing protein YvlB
MTDTVHTRRTRVLTLLALALAVSAPARAQDRARRERDKDYKSGIDTTFAFDERGTVTLALGSGEIIVTAWSRDQIKIHATSEGQGIRLDAGSTRVSLELTSIYRNRGDARFEVTVPVGARLIARARSGDVSIRGVKGDVEARTENGDITVADVGQRLDLVTLSGDVDARGIVGDVQIKTMNGEVKVSDLRGDFEAESVSGDIEVRNAEGRYVRAHTTSGDVLYDGNINPSGRYELVTHSGDVHLVIPANTGAQLSISTWSGAIESDFPITLKPGEHGIGTAQAKRFTFEIGNGAARVTAESFSGDVTIASRGSTRP